MDKIADSIKNFIINKVNAELSGLTETGLTLPTISSADVVFGVVDLSRYEKPIIVSILPETQNETGDDIDGVNMDSTFIITFLFQKIQYDKAMKRMCRYAKAFWLAQAKNPDFTGVEDSTITNIQYFPDAGVTPQQMTAVEITLDTNTFQKL